MGVDYGIINHTKRQYIRFDRRLHNFTVAHGEWLCKHWLGDQLEIAADTGGKLQDVAEYHPLFDGQEAYEQIHITEEP